MPVRSNRRHPHALALAGALLLAGCNRQPPPPTEKMAPVLSDGPLITEIAKGKGTPYLMRAHELVQIVKTHPAKEWKAKAAGTEMSREGPVVQVRRAAGDELLFGWKSDLGDEIEVPTASWLCDQLANAGLPPSSSPARCGDALRRVKLSDGAIAAFVECATGPCPMALVRGGKLSAIAIEGMTTARPIVVEGKVMLLAESRWSRDNGTWTGGKLVPIAFDGDAPRPLTPIDIDEQDSRNPAKSTSRVVGTKLDATPAGLTAHVTGERTETDATNGNVLGRAAIDETYTLTSSGARRAP